MREQPVWFGFMRMEEGSVNAAILSWDVDTLTKHAISIGSSSRLPCSLSEIAISTGSLTHDEYYSMLKQVASRIAMRRLKGSMPREWKVARAIDSLDELTRCANVLSEKLKESEEIVSLVGEPVSWTGALDEAMVAIGTAREQLIGEVGRAVVECAPNTALIATPLVAARLMAEAGSLRRLAALPASSIQVLGARTALFKHLRGRAPSPKHGVIYSHPALARVPRERRGRCARMLAAHIAIAARLDYFRGTVDEKFVARFRKRLGEVGVNVDSQL